MPNYSIVANSTYKPFSYQELLAPVLHLQQVQDQLAEQYDKLSSQADILEAMGANDKNSKAYWGFKNYSDSLRAEADNLYRNGLNSESRMRLSELKRRYNSEIVPIQNAWNKRELEAEMQMKARLSNPMIRFTREAANTPIDDYIANPTGGYGVINLANIATQAGAAFKNLENQIRGGAKIQGIDSTTNAIIFERGLTPEMINEWLANPEKNPAMTNILNSVLATNGVTPEMLQSNPNLFKEATKVGQLGAWNAVGKPEIQLNEDKAKDYALRDYYDLLKEQRELNNLIALAKAKGEGEPDMPEWSEERVGIKTADGYVTDAPEQIGKLKAGYNSLKASYFGKRGDVNPLKVYEEYQKALNEMGPYAQKYDSPKSSWNKQQYSSPTSSWNKRTNEKESTEKTNDRIKRQITEKYGISDILSKEQYNLLTSMGYNNKSSFRSGRFNDMQDRLNNMAKQHTRYSTKMTGYDIPDDAIRTNLLRMTDKQVSANVFDMQEDGTMGNAVKTVDSLKLKANKNGDENHVKDIQYDPQQKTKLLITFSDGTRKYINPDVIDAKLTTALMKWEREEYDPRVITSKITAELKKYNKQQGKTGDK